jgi:hypothetical protein
MSVSTPDPPAVGEARVSAQPEPAAPAAAGTLLYRRIWRWHFYAGLFSVPVLLVAAATGALYVFVEELQPVFYPELSSSRSAGSQRRTKRSWPLCGSPRLMQRRTGSIRPRGPTSRRSFR